MSGLIAARVELECRCCNYKGKCKRVRVANSGHKWSHCGLSKHCSCDDPQPQPRKSRFNVQLWTWLLLPLARGLPYSAFSAPADLPAYSSRIGETWMPAYSTISRALSGLSSHEASITRIDPGQCARVPALLFFITATHSILPSSSSLFETGY